MSVASPLKIPVASCKDQFADCISVAKVFWQRSLAIFFCWQISLCIPCLAQETRPAKPQLIRLEDLPTPPPEIKRWLDAGDLQISFGGREPSSAGISAETSYRMVHRYRSHPRWTIRKNGSTRTCLIQLRFRSIKMSTSHEIWFLKQPDSATFWTNPLVLHELDHLRLSSDPRLAKRFDELVHEKTLIERKIKSGEFVNGQWIRKQVDQFVQDHFTKVSDIAAIRYKELDRLTAHGRQEIPGDSEIAKTLAEIDR